MLRGILISFGLYAHLYIRVAGAQPPLWFSSPLPQGEGLGVRVSGSSA
jgi:hypothetical protein